MNQLLKLAFALLAALTVACQSAPSDIPAEKQPAAATETAIPPASDAFEDASISLERMQGEWVHEQDSLALVTVSGNTWTDRYGAYPGEELGSYTISLTDSLPHHATASATETYLLQVSATDTLFFVSNGMTDSTLSLMHLPTGRLHLYLKIK